MIRRHISRTGMYLMDKIKKIISDWFEMGVGWDSCLEGTPVRTAQNLPHYPWPLSFDGLVLVHQTRENLRLRAGQKTNRTLLEYKSMRFFVAHRVRISL